MDGRPFQISKTYCISATRAPVKHRPKKQESECSYSTDVFDHVFSHRREGSRVGNVKGWLRVTKHDVPDGHADWKIGKRKREPEKEAPSTDKLHAKMVAQLTAGELPRTCTRRASLAERVRTECSNRKRKRAKDLRVGVSMKRLRIA